MTKTYPVVENKFRFLGGWTDIPSNLHELVVGRGYDITPSGKEFIIRGAAKLILIDQKTKDKYFEPFIDYFAHEDEEEETRAEDFASTNTITHEVEVNSPVGFDSNTEIEENDQLSLF
ncbi:hypothetical protein Q9R38_26060 [Priestia aryabhattai]|uniref:hypothetical protein n=1 Tax=Priestia aryabhattai TaxID=412384 RepID=UPI0028819672|nr:hypothetical protein [Priestia aryabhattai]MDT0150009.1 hypothetical protein [Priestia aryabhattai]MDT0155579.1 hypothetical protein [Priestia aryabhattai]